MFVKSLGYKEASPVQTPRKKIDLGQCSNSAQVKVALRRQPQAQPTRALQANTFVRFIVSVGINSISKCVYLVLFSG